jgi:hypothetical protein
MRLYTLHPPSKLHSSIKYSAISGKHQLILAPVDLFALIIGRSLYVIHSIFVAMNVMVRDCVQISLSVYQMRKDRYRQIA